MIIPKTKKIIETSKNGCISYDSHIFDKIISFENLCLAWKEFKKGKNKKIEVQNFSFKLEDNLFKLHEKLKSGLWRHGCYEEFLVSDPKLRNIHKARIEDRILHHAVVRILEPIFEKTFVFDTYSCRKDKGTHLSILILHKRLDSQFYGNKNKIFILKCDIKKYFENIDHEILISLIKKYIKDEKAILLLKEIIDSFNSGIPLGNLTSQLFANIYLSQFDHFVKEKLRIKNYMRYYDDFVIIGYSKSQLEDLIIKINKYLKDKLGLDLHPNKVKILLYHNGVDWLGYRLYPSYRLLRNKSKKRMWRKIDAKLHDYLQNIVDRKSFISVINSYLGMIGYSWNKDDGEKIWNIVKYA